MVSVDWKDLTALVVTQPVDQLREGLPVDAHAHLHGTPLVSAALDAAAFNFRRFASSSRGLAGMLLLAEMDDEMVYESLLGMERLDDWSISRIDNEPQTLIARRADQRIAIVCGRQIRTAEGLEIAALGTRQRYSDGRSFSESLDEVLRSDAVATVPWGFGKWTGSRGAQVRSLLAFPPPARVYLVDSANRGIPIGEPAPLRRAKALGLAVLAGSDPFPLWNDHLRLGSFGFLAGCERDARRPWAALKGWLDGATGSPPFYGQRCSALKFLANQVGIQIYNYRYR